MSQQSANEPYDSHALRLAPETLESLGWTADTVGIVIVDHGSRRDESNEMLLQVAAMFREAKKPCSKAGGLVRFIICHPTLALQFAML